jgi:hypothetical protein
MRPGCIWWGGGQSVYVTDKNTLILQSCTDVPRVEHGLCGKTSVQSSDDNFEVISINIKAEEIHIKEEVEPIAISFSSIKDEPEVSPHTFHGYLGLQVVNIYRPFPFTIQSSFMWKGRQTQQHNYNLQSQIPVKCMWTHLRFIFY